MVNYKTEYWLTDEEINKIGFSRYWNDEKIEKQKDVLYIKDGNFTKLENYLQGENSISAIETAFDLIRKKKLQISGTGVDLAAGVLWATPQLFKRANIDRIFCVEYSHHRLTKIGPLVLEHYGVPAEKVTLARGSFYNLKLPASSVDFVFMSAAFHHAADPDRLLIEIKRILKPGGVIIMIGENYLRFWREYPKYIVKFFISRLIPERLQMKFFNKTFQIKSIFPDKEHFLPPDTLMGDHYYTMGQYKQMFKKYGFKSDWFKQKKNSLCGFILVQT